VKIVKVLHVSASCQPHLNTDKFPNLYTHAFLSCRLIVLHVLARYQPNSPNAIRHNDDYIYGLVNFTAAKAGNVHSRERSRRASVMTFRAMAGTVKKAGD